MVILEGIVLATCAHGVEHIVDGFRTEQGVEMVVAPYIVVGCGVCPCPSVALAEVFAHAIHVGSVGLASERHIVVLDMLDTDVGLEVQSFHPWIHL